LPCFRFDCPKILLYVFFFLSFSTTTCLLFVFKSTCVLGPGFAFAFFLCHFGILIILFPAFSFLFLEGFFCSPHYHSVFFEVAEYCCLVPLVRGFVYSGGRDHTIFLGPIFFFLCPLRVMNFLGFFVRRRLHFFPSVRLLGFLYAGCLPRFFFPSLHPGIS